MKQVASGLCSLLLALFLATAGADKPEHVESPPEGIPPNEFATNYTGCLGGLRSAIARGEVDGFDGFSRDVNPGKHQGTIGEEEFLKALLGIESEAELAAFCSQFE